MEKIALIAGGGNMPIEFVRSANEKGDEVVVFAINGVTSPGMNDFARKIHWFNFGDYPKFIFLMMKERIKKIVLLGKVKKEDIYKDPDDSARKEFFAKVKNKNDYTLLKEFTNLLAKVGVEVIDPSPYLAHLMPQRGVLSKKSPDGTMKKDIDFGYETAKKLAALDIGQTVIVRNSAIVALEALEGTDAVISRAKEVAGPGCVMVKVSRPAQDMRWDVPTIGLETMKRLIENEFSAIAFEGGKTYFVDKPQVLELADSRGIVVEAL